MRAEPSVKYSVNNDQVYYVYYYKYWCLTPPASQVGVCLCSVYVEVIDALYFETRTKTFTVHTE